MYLFCMIHSKPNWPNKALKELRKIIGCTQGEFAAMIGASKDAVVSWEVGRNKLSESFARRIGLVTGAEAKPLLAGKGRLTCLGPRRVREPFTAETFERHSTTYWGRSDEAAVRQHFKNCADALKLLLVGASRAREKIRYRLPAVLDSFIQWCERTREDFQLEQEIDAQLEQRCAKLVISHTYGQWRAMRKEDPAACRAMGFKDDAEKADGENLTLETTTLPIWRPGFPMRGR
jgi:DNA-binding XRE family transcriptional regulator